MAIQLAADMAPNGARQADWPEARASTRAAEAEGGVRRLPDRAEAQDVPAEAGGHRQHGGDHRAAGAGEVTAPVDPGGLEPEGLFDGGDAAFAHAHAGRARIGRQPVDVVELQPGVGHSLQAGIDGQARGDRPSAAGRAPTARPRTARRGARTDRHSPVGAEGGGRGSATGLSARAIARRLEQREPDVVVVLEPDGHLACPMATSAGSLPTIMVVSRTVGSSARATTAMT